MPGTRGKSAGRRPSRSRSYAWSPARSVARKTTIRTSRASEGTCASSSEAPRRGARRSEGRLLRRFADHAPLEDAGAVPVAEVELQRVVAHVLKRIDGDPLGDLRGIH